MTQGDPMKNSIETMATVIQGPGKLSSVTDRSIGAMLIDAGKITPEDAERILRYAREKSVRFGDAAVALKLVTDADIQQALSRQFDYPYLTVGQSDVSESVVAAWQPFSNQVEALRAVRSQLLLRWCNASEGQNVLAVVSGTRGEGRSYLASNLAVVFSQMGERTLLVDADLRNPVQHELFHIRNSGGLSTVLAERTGIEVIQRVGGFVDLSVLPAGPTPPNPLELLGRAAFGDLVSQLSGQFDVVIIDTPAAALGSDFQLIAQRVRGTLMLAQKNRSSMSVCAEVANDVRAAGGVVVGGILNER